MKFCLFGTSEKSELLNDSVDFRNFKSIFSFFSELHFIDTKSNYKEIKI